MVEKEMRRLVKVERIADPREQCLAGLMVSHYQKIQETLNNSGERLTEAQWAMDWCETTDSKGEKVYVLAGLLPAMNKDGKEIRGMRATPAVFCIPKRHLTVEEEEYFDKERKTKNDQERRARTVEAIIKDQYIHKLYNMHGWGADPYVSALPMIEAASEMDGVSVLLGMMGSMGTTKQDQLPRNFVKSSGYDWEEIRKQAIGVMYYLEGADAFDVSQYGDDEIVRIVFGHSMQGKTTLRMIFDNLDQLPNTFFVPMTPVLAGGSKKALSLAHKIYMHGTGRHVNLGHNPAGVLMQIELKTLAKWLRPELREKILLQPLILHFMKLIMMSYLGKGESWGEDIIFYAHMLEYISNPHAILQATENLEDSKPTVSEKTVRSAANLLDKFMLVYAGEDRVLSPRQLRALAGAISAELGVSVETRAGQLVIKVDGNEWVIPMFESDNHYLKEGSWKDENKGVIGMVRRRVGW